VEGTLQLVWTKEKLYIQCAVFSKYEKQIFIGSTDEILILDLDGCLIGSVDQPCQHLCVSSDGRLLGATFGNSVYIYSLETVEPKLQRKLKAPHNFNLNCAAFTDNGTYLITGGEKCELYIFNLDGTNPLLLAPRTIAHHRSPILGIAISSTRNQFSSICSTCLAVWSLSDATDASTDASNPVKFLYTKETECDAFFSSIAYDAGGLHIAAAGTNDSLFIFDAETGELKRTECDIKAIDNKARSDQPSGKIAFSTKKGGRFFRAFSKKLTMDSLYGEGGGRNYTFCAGSFNSMVISPDSKFVSTVMRSKTLYSPDDVKIHNMRTGAILPRSDPDEKSFKRAVAYGPKGDFTCELASTKIIFKDVNGMTLHTVFGEHGETFNTLCVSPSKKYLLVIFNDHFMKVYDLLTQGIPLIQTKNIGDRLGECDRPVISFDDKYVAICTWSLRVTSPGVVLFKLFAEPTTAAEAAAKDAAKDTAEPTAKDAAEPTTEATVVRTFPNKSIVGLSFTHDNSCIIIGSLNGNFYKYRISDGVQLYHFKGFFDDMVSFDLSLDNKYICAVDNHEIVKIMCAETGKVLYDIGFGLQDQTAFETWGTILFSPDNKYICAASNYGLRIWNNPCQYYTRASRDVFMKTRFFAETELEMGKGRLKLLGLDLQDNLLSSMRLGDFE
jgi:WD40 repeat protein